MRWRLRLPAWLTLLPEAVARDAPPPRRVTCIWCPRRAFTWTPPATGGDCGWITWECKRCKRRVSVQLTAG